MLPDTGLDAKREIQVSFIQHDPDLAGELSEVAIQPSWPQNADADPELDPRVRLLDASGHVFVDTLGTRAGTGFSRATWFVLHWIKDASSRNGLYGALSTETAWLELWRPGASAPGRWP